METIDTEIDARRGIVEIVAGTALDTLRVGVRIGLGLSALALESAQQVGAEALRRGTELETRGRETAVELERRAVDHMKDYLRRNRSESRDDAIEARVEQALATFDVPTRNDIRELHNHLAAIGEKLNRLGAS